MALLYPWATKEYLLWNMSIGQIIFYHNKGIKIKNGEDSKAPGLMNKSFKEVKAFKEEMKAQTDLEKSNNLKAQYAAKYGAI
jgi:hypothetical protein